MSDNPYVLQLMPHVIEDFCRVRRLYKRSSNFNDRIWNPSQKLKVKKLIRTANPDCVRKIEIKKCEPPNEELSEIPHSRACVHQVPASKCDPRTKLIGSIKPKVTVSENKKNILGHPSSEAVQQKASANKRIAHIVAARKNLLVNPKILKCKRANEMQRRKKKIENTINRLSKPKQFNISKPNPPWALTKAMEKFKPSLRLLDMSEPKWLGSDLPLQVNVMSVVKKSALQYKASQRIMELAMPPAHSLLGSELREPFKVSRKALSAILTERVAQLAAPRIRLDRNVRKRPFQVPRRALNARISRHIRELALPKGARRE